MALIGREKKELLMVKISIQPDCGNSPRKGFLRDFHINMANGDLDALSDQIPENISWYRVGLGRIAGRLAFAAELRKSPFWKVKSLSVETVITHGSEASVSGTVVSTKGKAWAFCNVYKFSAASGFKLTSITSFLLLSGT
jgi:hypothetical protein